MRTGEASSDCFAPSELKSPKEKRRRPPADTIKARSRNVLQLANVSRPVVIAKFANIFGCQTRNGKVQPLGRLLQEVGGKNDYIFQSLA